MRILITGGAGFIGSNLVRSLLQDARTTEITVIDDLSTGRLANLSGLNVEFIHGSILDTQLLRTITTEVDAIVHLAALGSVPRSVDNPTATNDVNINGTLNVLEAARSSGVKQVIVASSSSVYGSNPILPKPELTWTRPMSPYAVSKLATEAYANSYFYSYGLKTLAFRFFNVYGPRQAADHIYAAVIPRFIDALVNDQPLTIHGDGTQSRDFTYVGTVCSAISLALFEGISHPDPINLAFGSQTTLLSLISILSKITGLKPNKIHEPIRVGDVKASSADNELLMSLFPTLNATPLETGLQETVNWFKSN